MKTMDHIVLNVDNIDIMLAFYMDVIGLSPERVHEYHEGKVPFPSVRINSDTIIDLFPKSMHKKESHGHSKPNHLNHFCLSLEKEEWDTLRQRIENHNISIEEGPVNRWGAHGAGISIYFRDPEGNMLEARYYPTGSTKSCLLGT
jgi:extradiol dioxygenase family protein